VAILLLQNGARVLGCDKYVPNDKFFGMPFVSKESLSLSFARAIFHVLRLAVFESIQ
jgi:hypothetical protein